MTAKLNDVGRARALLAERDGELRANLREDVAALALAFRRARRETRPIRPCSMCDANERQAKGMWERMEDACERADAATAALAKERTEHVNDIAIGERRLIRCEAERDAALARAAAPSARVEALRNALADLLRFQPNEGRANRSHYAEHGMLCLCAYDGKGRCDCGWTEWKAAEARARAALRDEESAP